jgi:hypothetical protein
MGVLTGLEGYLGELDDTVSVIIPDGLDRLQTVTVGDPAALSTYLGGLAGRELDIVCVAADCRDGLIPSSFQGHYVGTTQPSGWFSATGLAFEFIPVNNDGDSVALPFGWLIAIRAL